MPRRRPAASLVALASLLACGPGSTTSTETDATTGDPTAPTTGDGEDALPQTLWCVERKQLDLLFVIEDAPAMAPAQAAVARLAGDLARVFEELHDFDVRMAFVRTGGDACDGSATGEFRAVSCNSRLEDFVDPAAAAACPAACPFDQVETLPTPVDGDPAPAPRPWLESITDATNVALPFEDAAACLAPQGDAGCLFPAPLTAMSRALDRALDPADPAHGFLRADARLLVAFIGATPDCSLAPGGDVILSETSPFLSDPPNATPGACWNAGMRCSGAPEALTCAPENFAADGSSGASDADAVLTPVATHAQRLQSLVDSGLVASVGVVVLGGVPTGYPQKPLVHTTACDPTTIQASGICPGCAADDLAASPPGRLLALAQTVAAAEEPQVASLCGDLLVGFAPQLDSLADQIKPGCVETCAADGDPATPTLEPACTVLDAPPGETPAPLPACIPADDGSFLPPADAPACAALLVGDARSVECVDQAGNTEVLIVRTTAAADGTCTTVTCDPSPTPATDCPGP